MSVKAFELVPAVDRDLLMGDQPAVSIECVECCGRRLYVGTSDCFLHHFLLVEVTSGGGAPAYASQKLLHRHLGLKRPVAELRAASALQRLIVLCDGVLFLADMVTLETVASAAGGGAKIRGVTTFCVNENPVNGDPFCVEMAVLATKRRSVQVFMVYEDRVQLLKEVTTPEQPCALSVDGYFLCLALATQYVIMNYNTGASQDLFPYNSEERRPIVKRISREEFLLAAPGGLGMFANSSGASQRAPVSWSEGVLGAAVCFPYVLALDESFVTVHSMLDQQLKQSLAFRDGHILQDFEGKVIVASSKAVYVLVPLPLEKQIQDLLSSHRVEEALLLTEGAQRNIPKERFQVLQRRILQQAGFIQFSRLRFVEAKELFRRGELDVRELISLCPNVLPSSSSFSRVHPPLHHFADLHHLARGDADTVARCKAFLVSYLAEIRGAAGGFREDVDTALLKLYAEHDHAGLLDLLASDNACLLEDSAPWLQKHQRYFALGLLYHARAQDAAALQLWQSVVDGTLTDASATNLYDHIVDFLRTANTDLLWKHAEWTLNKDQTKGVAIFTRRAAAASGPAPEPEQVLTVLERHDEALLLYLEHLVLERRLQKEAFHTLLAVLYVERTLALLTATPRDGERLSRAREKLHALLRESNRYRVSVLLGKLESCEDLLLERATLLGRLEQHDAALHILVRRLRDFPSAEAFCLWASSGRDAAFTQTLFHRLLAAYLDRGGEGGVADGELDVAAVDLLNRHGELFDAVRVLRTLPERWSLQLLRPFLGRAVRASVHAQRTSQIAVGLARAENLQLLHDRLSVRRKPILVSEKKGCFLCHNTFSEPGVACLPGGVPVHTQCAARRLRDSPANTRFTSNSGGGNT